MNSNLSFVLKSILKFYGVELSDSSIRKIIHKNKKLHSTVSKSSLSENLNKVGREQSTFRKGVTGEWRSLFNQELIDYVKIYSAETLINSGYEKDNNW